ncbi:MAG: hypothetical protein JSC189_001026 [Candidatus Tokpelaia sp. JSC189]|nr:MAG: hypothetical protein JSC189_001026 [Candidatus Tokpelaia sp. JSC189]
MGNSACQLFGAYDEGDDLRTDRLVSDMKAVLDFAPGRRLLLWLVEVSGVLRSPWTGDVAATQFRLGEQNMGLRLIALMGRVGEEEYPKLLVQAAQENERMKARHKQEEG